MVRLGKYELHALSDGFFRLDGGAMYGVVPRVLWEKLQPPDDKNRIKLSLSCILVRTGKHNVLIETGIGEKHDPKWNEMFCVEHPTTLPESLKKAGVSENDIDVVILTHLHFDHAGWATRWDANKKPVPTFPKARYVIQKIAWEEATMPDERTRASYHPDDFLPIQKSGQLELIEGDHAIVDGVSVHLTGGHIRGHQVVFVDSDGKRGVYFGDLIPTTHHLKLPYIMGYDLFPQETLRAKKDLLGRAVKERWLCMWEHDPDIAMGYITDVDKGFKVETVA